MKVLTLVLTALLSAPSFASEVTDAYELEPGCKVQVVEFYDYGYGFGRPPKIAQIRVDRAVDDKPMFATFEFDGRTGLPASGPTICNSRWRDIYPDVIKEEHAGFIRYQYKCGGTLSPIDVTGEIILNKKTGRVEFMKIDNAIAYEPVPIFKHSGPVKVTTDKFSCQSSAYVQKVAPVFATADVQKTISTINGDNDPFSREYGRVVHGKYIKIDQASGEPESENVSSQSKDAR